jgi:hypothetical protein
MRYLIERRSLRVRTVLISRGAPNVPYSNVRPPFYLVQGVWGPASFESQIGGGYERVAAEYELRLVVRMNELAAAHPRYGSRRNRASPSSGHQRCITTVILRCWHSEWA